MGGRRRWEEEVGWGGVEDRRGRKSGGMMREPFSSQNLSSHQSHGVS